MIVLCAAVLVAAPVCAVAGAAADRQVLTILHTSDLHGQVLPEDGPGRRGSLAQVATVVGRIRAEVDHPVLVLDSGDALQGSPLEELARVRWSRPSPTVAAMNRIGYQAMAVGNHEFNYGLASLRRAEAEAAFPLLSANTVDASTGQPAFPPFTVLQAGPVRVGVLGLVTPGVVRWERPEHYRGLRFEAMDRTAREWVPRLRDEVRCDLVVVLAHTGFESPVAGRPGTGSLDEDFGSRLGRVDGIDLLLTGHTHLSIPPQRIDGVVTSQPGAHAAFMTRIDLALERDRDRWSIASFSGANLPLAGVAADPEMIEAFAGLETEVEEALAAPVGRVQEPLSVRGCRLADCAAVDLVHAVQLEASGADLSLASVLSDRTPDLEVGPVSARWVHDLYVYANTLMSVRVSGAEVRDILEHAARYYRGVRCGDGVGCEVEVDPTIPGYNVDSMAGVSYRIDPTRPEGDRVRDLRWRGTPLRPDEQLTLAVNSYRRSGGGRYPHLAEAEVAWSSGDELVDLIIAFLRRHDPWPAEADLNWILAPDVVSEDPSPTADATASSELQGGP